MSRRSAVRRAGLVLLVVNVALLALKAGAFGWTGSLAVGSEAANSLADAVYSVVTVAGLYLTTRPPDFEHPHGHERIEPFVSLLVAAGAFVAAGLTGYGAIQTVLAGTAGIQHGPVAMGVLAISIGVKLGFGRWCRGVADRTHSPALVATAKDARIDVLTASAALVGVVGTSLGAPVFDPVAAILVAVGIAYTGIEIVSDNVDYVVGAAPPEDLREAIVDRAIAHPDVHGAHDVVAHYVGPQVDVSLHVEIEGEHTLAEAHHIETGVVRAIEGLPEVDDAFVHIDPRDLDEWKPDPEVERLVKGGDGDPAGPTDNGEAGPGTGGDPGADDS
ncbi:MAG: cation diffusion facilitator family transporter [Halococcoides sp.]